MSIKLLALGNVLMGDDGIAVYAAAELEDRLNKLGIDVIYGETDVGYSISRIERGDYIIIMDAASLGKAIGRITKFKFKDYSVDKGGLSQHNMSFLDLLKLYFPENDGMIIAIEIEEIRFHYGPGKKLKARLEMISQEIFEIISNSLYPLECYDSASSR